MTKFSCFITGDDYEMVKGESVSSKKKINTLAMAVFVPVIMWFCATLILLLHVLESSLLSSFVAALLISLLVFIIEKSIVMSNGNKILFLFRFVLGLFVALLGSLAIDEVVFKNDIDNQVMEIRNDMISNEKHRISKVNEGELFYLENQKAAKYAAWQYALKDAKQEADGTGGSGQRGVSEITRLKEKQANLLKSDYEKAELKLNEVRSGIEEAKKVSTLKLSKGFNENSLLLRIKAMFMLVKSNMIMLFVYILFTGFLFSLEFLVVILKSTLGKTAYERKLEAIEAIAMNKIKNMENFERDHFHPEDMHEKVKSAKNYLSTKKSSVFN